MMHTSSEFFSLFLSRAKGVCPNTPGLYSSPTLLEGKSRSWCSKHLSGTPDLFSFPGCSPSRKEMNSVSLFSFSNHSLLSSSSSPICSDEQQFSSSVSNRNEPDASSVINSLESENKFVQNDLQAISLHSSPTIQTILLNFCTDRVRRLEFHRCCPAFEDLQSPSQILKHLCDFPLPNVDLGLQSV